MMNDVEKDFNRKNASTNFSLMIHADHPIYNHQCTTTRSDYPIKCLFENKSNYTKDSSMSSSSSQSYETNITNASVCPSVKSLDQSHNSNYSSSKLVENFHLNKNKNLFRDDFHETLSSTVTNSSSLMKSKDHEENVKITKAFSLEYTSTTRITPPQINDCPEIVRTNLDIDLPHKEVESNLFVKDSRQLQSDKRKLFKSEFMTAVKKNDRGQTPAIESVNSHFQKSFKVRSIQTLPVLIYPMSCEDKMIETEEKTIGVHEQSQSVFSDEVTLCNIIPVKTLQKETQAPPNGKSRTRRVSEQNYFSKYRSNMTEKCCNKSEGVSTDQQGIWGDVYNDYKQFNGLPKDRSKSTRLRTSSAKINKTNSRKTLDSIQTGDDLTKQISERTISKKKATHSQSIPPAHINSEGSKSINRGSIFDDNVPIVQNFLKCFQVQPFDEIVKSYLTPSDRRIQAVCSRMKCKIRMFGPTSRLSSESRTHSSSSVRDKIIYHMIIGTSMKEQMDKTLKCIQETFPKDCLNERTIIKQNLETYGEEIPL